MTVNLRHIVPSQRRHYRVTVPIAISIDGAEYTATNWSISGFKVAGMQEEARPGQIRHVYIKIPFHGFDVGFIAKARVVRYERPTQEMAAEFINLDARGQETLGTFVQGIVSGEMAAIDGVIKRLDLPVTPATLTPPESQMYLSPEAMEEKRRKGMKAYLIAGKLLAAVLVVVLYTNLFELKIDTAFVMGRNDVILSPGTGEVTILANPKTPVAAGTPLIAMADQKLEDDIQAADYRTRDATVEANRVTAMLDLEKKRLSAANNIVSSEMQASANTQKSLERNLQVKRDSLALYQDLYKKGYASRILVDRAEAEYLAVESQLNAEKQEAAKRAQEYSTIQTGFQVRDAAVETGVHDAEEMRKAAADRLNNAQAELTALKNRKEKLMITAPADGQLVSVFTPSSGKYGEPLAIFERNGTRVIQAFLTQQEALHVSPGQTASVYFPGHLWSVPVKVADIDYYSLTLGQTQGIFQWQNFQNDQFKTVIVTLEPVSDKALTDLKQVASGTAASVVFTLI